MPYKFVSFQPLKLDESHTVIKKFTSLPKNASRDNCSQKNYDLPILVEQFDVIVDRIEDAQIIKQPKEDNKELENSPTKTTLRISESSNEFDSSQVTKLNSWDENAQSIFVSQLPLDEFDAIYQKYFEHQSPLSKLQTVVSDEILTECLNSLVLGQDCLIGKYNYETKKMELTLQDIRVLGCSPHAVQYLIESSLKCGTYFRRLDELVHTSVYGNKPIGKLGMAFAVGLSRYLEYLRNLIFESRFDQTKKKLIESSFFCRDMESNLKVFAYFCRCGYEDSQLEYQIEKGVTLLNNLNSYSRFCSNLSSSIVKGGINFLFDKLLSPYLKILKLWTGIHDDDINENSISGMWSVNDPYGEFFIKELKTDSDFIDDQAYAISVDCELPFFISREFAEQILDCGISYRILTRYSIKRSQLLRNVTIRVQSPFCRSENVINGNPVSLPDRNESDESVPIESQFRIYAEKPRIIEDTELAETIQHHISTLESNESLTNFDVKVDMEIIKPIKMHARSVESAILALYFEDLHLLFHLNLLRRTILMGDNRFVLGLRDAIFGDGNRNKEEVGLGAGIGLGVRLRNRSTWPPGGAELSLALRSVLMDSMDDVRFDPKYAGLYKDLEMQLSFAVRDLSMEEFEACKNPQAIEALDFLYIDYKPPAPLDIIISPRKIIKYNRIFNYLLRLARVETVARQIHRDVQKLSCSEIALAQRFSFEIQNFIQGLHGYVVDVAIGLTWFQFITQLESLRDNLEGNNEIHGLRGFQTYHDYVLDRILYQCLLRKKQEPIMKIITNIFVVILGFGRVLQHRKYSINKESVPISKIYESFRGYVLMLVKVLKSLESHGGGTMGMGLKSMRGISINPSSHIKKEIHGDGKTSFLQALLIRIDFNFFYSKMDENDN